MAPPSRRSRGSTDRRGSLGQSLNSCTDEDEAPMDVEAALGQLNEPRHQPQRLSAHNPKDYLDPKALQNYSAQRLYRKYIIEDVLPWCRPLANIPGITDCGFWRERHQSATSLRDSPCPSGRRVSVGASMDGDSTKITYFSEDDEAVDETLTEADKIRCLNEEVQLHVRDMQMERRSHYTSQYSFGQAQQQLAKEDVAAFTRELGLTEAVAQLPPMEEVGVAIANMQRHTDHCDKMAAEAMSVDERLREVHVKIIETKIEHLIGEELRIAAIGMHRAQHEEEAATA